MERRELEAQRMKQLAEENRLKELKRKAREERRVRWKLLGLLLKAFVF